MVWHSMAFPCGNSEKSAKFIGKSNKTGVHIGINVVEETGKPIRIVGKWDVLINQPPKNNKG